MGKRKERLMVLPRATAGRGFVAPRYSAKARRFMIVVGGWYLRILEGVRNVEIADAELLIDELERFYNGEQRLVIAFRHVAKEDAPVMMYALNRKLQRMIRKRNRTRRKEDRIIPHARFLYGSDVLDWAGKAAAWLFPKIGCVPVQNRGNNKNGLDILRREMRDGTFPIALAPESQVTYHMYRCSPLAAGVASLAVWGGSDDKEVTIIPVAIGYRHGGDPLQVIRNVMHRWEEQTGLHLENPESRPPLELLLEATQLTVELLEQLYAIDRKKDDGNLRDRILHICEIAMRKAEMLALVEPQGSLLDRLFRIRYSAVEAIHPHRFIPNQLPQLGRSIADFHALEAHVYARHSQLVDVLQYVDPSYIAAPCSTGRACEYALSLLDVLNRVQGGNINTRYSPKGKKALVSVGSPVRVSEIEKTAMGLSRKERLSKLSEAIFEALQTTSEAMEPLWEPQVFDA
ncbi:MAG: hypothetical protein A2Y31_13630 [Spirochaetes bacterium GWC2_52_13]|nr:MAG: hypothetical protein A2Y31_13630 [Spirochaetes bacterium GWC2_52_13]HCG63076.1 hypothetical protein [Sphaerochaeta sp.]